MTSLFRILTVGASLVTIPSWALSAPIESQLVYGPNAANDEPVVWVFDETSGQAMGEAIDLECMKSDLMFKDDRSVARILPKGATRDCPDHMDWLIFENLSTATRRVRISYGSRECDFSVTTDARDSSLKLGTTCGQLPGQPRQFRYFVRLVGDDG